MRMPMPGEVIEGPDGNTLTLGEPCGRGAFGTVFRAKDDRGGDWAVKVPDAGVFSDAIGSAAFQNEVMAATRVDHPNVVRVVHASTTLGDFPPYLVMEWMPGGTLRRTLDEHKSAGRQLDTATLRIWSVQVAEGMRAINAKVLHRDLKPDNILIDGAAALRVSDFGLAKVVGAATRSLTFKGGQHVLYMAPEGWRHEANAIQIDMYSFGIVVYEMATGQYPYELPQNRGDIDAIRRMHLFARPTDIASLRALPTEFVHLVLRLMEKNPAHRFATWDEVVEALNRSWSTGLSDAPSTRSGNIDALLSATADVHHVVRSAETEAAQLAAQAMEEGEIDRYQMTQLLASIDQVVGEFNSRSSLGRIECSWASGSSTEVADRALVGTRFSVHLPKMGQEGAIELVFFQVKRPLSLRVGSIRFAARVEERFRGRGFNILLARAGVDDVYGTWMTCRMRLMPGLRDARKYHDGPEPFGLDASKMREIERGDSAIHVYVPEIVHWQPEHLVDLATLTLHDWAIWKGIGERDLRRWFPDAEDE